MKYNGKLYYVFPTAKKDKIYVGRQKQFDAYKGALARESGKPASSAGLTTNQSTAHIHIRGCGP